VSSAHTIAPFVVSYLQFFFNLSLLLVFFYFAVTVIRTVQKDVEEKVAEYSSSESVLRLCRPPNLSCSTF
jgi:hypothetical protein